jgi:hypothetical protein
MVKLSWMVELMVVIQRIRGIVEVEDQNWGLQVQMEDESCLWWALTRFDDCQVCLPRRREKK